MFEFCLSVLRYQVTSGEIDAARSGASESSSSPLDHAATSSASIDSSVSSLSEDTRESTSLWLIHKPPPPCRAYRYSYLFYFGRDQRLDVGVHLEARIGKQMKVFDMDRYSY